MAFISGSGSVSNSLLPGIRALPTVAVLADGRFLVTWMDDTEKTLQPDGNPPPVPGTDLTAYLANGWQISARLFAADGTALGSEFRAHSLGGVTPQDQFRPQVVALEDGTFLLAYETMWRTPSDDPIHVIGEVPELPPYRAIAGRIVTPQEGAPPAVSSEFVHLHTRPYPDTARRLWRSTPTETGSPTLSHYHGFWDVLQERYTTYNEEVGSIAQGEPQATIVYDTEHALGFGVTTDDNVKLAPLSGGGHVLAWQQREALGPGYNFNFNYDIYAQVLDAPGGDSIAIPVAVATGQQYEVEVAALGTGNFIVTWIDGLNGTTRGRVFDPLGNAVTPTLSLIGPGYHHSFDAISLIDGGFALTWVSGQAFVGTVYLAAFGHDGSLTMSPAALGVGSHPRVARAGGRRPDRRLTQRGDGVPDRQRC